MEYSLEESELVLRDSSNYSEDYWDNLDTSQHVFPNTLWHIRPMKEVVIKTVCMLIIGIIGIFLNSIILVILFKNKWLLSASNYLLGNLALMDLITLLFCPWFMLVRDFYQNFVLKNFGCRFEGFMQASLLLASVGAVMLVSYDRLAAAALAADARVTKRMAPILIVISWLVALAMSLPWIISREYMERQWLDYVEMYCVEHVPMLNIYWQYTVAILVWIPLGVMTVTYGTIMWRLEYSARELAKRGGGRCVARARSRAMRITALVLIGVTICRIPYTVLVYWRDRMELNINAVEGSYDIMWFTANFLIYVNCAVNPLIYGFTNIRFRRAMDRTPGVACFKFGSWCFVCSLFKRKPSQLEEKNTEKIFIIGNTPRPEKKLSRVIKNILHINRDGIELSFPKLDEATTKPTKVTPLKTEQI